MNVKMRPTALVLALLASGCATKSDVRDLQGIVAESAARQERILNELERDIAMSTDSLQREQSAGRVELQGSVLTRLNDISGRLDRLEALMGFVTDELGAIREDIRQSVNRAPATQFGGPTGVVPSTSASGEQSADQLMQQAIADYRESSLATAKMEFEAFIEDYPSDPRVAEARYRRALILRETDDLSGALEALKEIPELHPQDAYVPQALYQMAEIYVEDGQPGEARDVLRKMLADHPDHPLESLAQQLLRQIGGMFSASGFSFEGVRGS